MSITNHPLRQWAVDEMHLRRFAPVSDDCQIYQSVLLMGEEQRPMEDQHLIANKPPFDDWHLAPRSASAHSKAGIYFLWERHTEASTITLILPSALGAEQTDRYLHWLEKWPGSAIRATRIKTLPDPDLVEQNLAAMGIVAEDLVYCEVNNGLKIWSDFGIHKDGYGRLLVQGGDKTDAERGRIIQRVQELGNYRNLALMGFPTVQRYGPQVDELEQRLSEHAERVASATDEDSDEILLQELAEISAQLELIRSATGFRLSATTAYAEVAADRLNALDVKPVDNFQSLKEFTERRLVPAQRTCAVFQTRLARIAERISRIMHTLDVRIDTRIKAQNLRLMESMERSTQLQLRLQTLVEGLSVIAAAYYLVGLIAYITKGAAAWPSGSTSDVMIGIVTIPVILAIYLLVHRLRGKALKEADVKKDDIS
ncbi:DUF3422 family protein [Parasphingorhabdus sp.]|uniref:DUF3422 family protein n=1 Tax=Parasphingorhabdus sp. TaxID=2709688 RepID=UPI0035936388